MFKTTQKGNQAENNAIPVTVPETRIQTKLSIGAVNDPLEHEADAMADKVMSMQQVPSVAAVSAGGIQRKCAGCEEEEKLQRKPLASFIQRKGSSAGTVASDAVGNKINSSKGNGNNMDSHTQSFMQSRFGADFSDVKIHTGGEAIQMNRELNAKAFTVGNDIYFNEGQYNPSSGDGKHLLAHELTHTVQQGSGKNTLSPMLIQRTTLNTNGGEWKDDNYSTSANGSRHSVSIDLKFKPQTNVNATKIGLVQAVNSFKNGLPYQINNDATIRGRSISSADSIITNQATGETDAGYHIDRLSDRNNPIYGTDSLSAGQGLTSSVEGGNNTFGWRYTNPTGVLQQRDATLHDETGLNNSDINSGQIFETTAFAFDGVQTGMFYGSVKWGWRTNGSGNLTQIPFQVASQGVPTSTFIKATELWNSSTTSGSDATVDLRAVDVQLTNVANINLNQFMPGSLPQRLLPLGTRVHIMRVTSTEPALAGKVFVRVVDGLHVGHDGWIERSTLVDERS
jgi:hypothetical protein